LRLKAPLGVKYFRRYSGFTPKGVGLIGSVLTLEKARASPNPKGEYIPSKSELCTFSKKEYAILSYFGCTPLWGWGKLGLFRVLKQNQSTLPKGAY
jgi:hypothetical protein